MMQRFCTTAVLVFFGLIFRSQVPTPSIVISPSVICSGGTATFTSLSPSLAVNAYAWTYSPATGANVVGVSTGSVYTLHFTNPGRYTVGLKWDFGTLGSSSKTVVVNVIQSAVSAFNASLTGYGHPNRIELNDFSVAANKIYWVFDGNFASKDSSSHTAKDYMLPGTYKVTHIALGGSGCNDTSSYSFTIADKSKMELPNIFTPNDDGINDIFRPIMEGISTLHVMIFNRFGILVREWNTVNGSWDGHNGNGVACDIGTYFVIAEGTGFDNTDFKLKGSLTLMR